MGIFTSIDIASSGLTAERVRMDVISENVANANTTRTESGEAFRRKFPVFMAREEHPNPFRRDGAWPSEGRGVKVVGIARDPSPFRRVHDPSHPDADAQGYVSLPNVNMVTEMVNLITASRAYEANSTVVNAAKGMIMKALEIGGRAA